MGCYTNGISISRIDETDLGLVVTAHTVHREKVIQCYVSGDLAAWQRAENGTVRFALPQAGRGEGILLLAVDASEASRSFWAEVAGACPAHGNRIRVRLERGLGWSPTDTWRVYLGAAGEASAAVKVHEAALYPGGRGATGWGFVWGTGGWGYDANAAPGWGVHWGRDWGFGLDHAEWTSDPLPRGRYPVRVTVVDASENESPSYETAVTIDTYARPAEELDVDSYDKASDTLVLSFTPSEDLH